MTSPDLSLAGPPEPVAPEDPPDESGLVPPVVVTMVAHDPGDWFDETLASLAAQDYPNLSVLVVDAGSAEELIHRVAAVLPSAYVRRLEANPGFSAAANEVLDVVEGASFYCFCHDDIAVDPSAVRVLVEEALRSNAAVVGPKLVDWDEPGVLRDVGLTADKTGYIAPLIERGERDQEQHDAIRDVFAVPSACVLVRADLFRAIGGFDPVIEYEGEDLDLCWRAQVAGARIVVVPDARVRHRSRIAERRDDVHASLLLRARHRLRTVLVCYGRFHLARVLPQAFALMLAEVAVAVATGRFRQANELTSAWTWNLGRLDEIRERRRALRAVRTFPDSEVRKLQAHGSARLSAFVRGEIGQAEQLRSSLLDVGRGITESFSSGPRRMVLAAWILLAIVVVIGSRDLVAGRIPLASGFAPIATGPFELLREYLRGWHNTGLGAESPVPTAVAMLGLAELVLLGAGGALQLVLVVGMLPLGALGAWRLTKPFASHRARGVCVGLYLANPLPYDAIGRGSWGGVLLYGASPWLLAQLLRATGREPFAARSDAIRRTAAYGVVLALLTAFVPAAALLFIVVALAIAAASMLVGGARAAAAAAGLALAGAGVAFVLHLPWTLDFVLPGADWWSVGGVSPVGPARVSVGDLLRFQVGSVGVPALGWAVPLAAVLPLVIGRDWRFAWAVRSWAIALACWALAWAGGNDLLPFDVPPLHVLLAPAAIALALAAALGMLAFEIDLRGYRFGVRQLASMVAVVLGVAAVLPVLVASFDGRWESPRVDLARALAFLDDRDLDGGYRTLWIGDPEVLPMAGHRLSDDLAFGISLDGTPDVVDRVAVSPSSSTELIGDALGLVATGRSDRLGRLLAPFGIRYVVLLASSAPARANGVDRALPDGMVATIGRQLDLKRVPVDPVVHLFESTAAMPVRALLPSSHAAALESGQLFSTAAATDFGTATPAVGEIGSGVVHLATPASGGWHLEVDGEDAERGKSLGWANRFTVASGGTAHLRFDTSPTRYGAVLAQALFWFIAVRLATRRR